MSAGGCALGLGTCCVFAMNCDNATTTIDTTGAQDPGTTVNQNRSYIRNRVFPSMERLGHTCKFRIEKATNGTTYILESAQLS